MSDANIPSPWHLGEKQLQARVGVAEQMEVFGPECVKTLSYRACFSPLLLGVATSRLFTTISAGNASERV